MTEAFQSPPLPHAVTDAHAETVLAPRGISVQFAAVHGVRSIHALEELPEAFQASRYAATPGLLFTWYSPTAGEVFQYRPDVPELNEDGKPVKYFFPRGQRSVLSQLRPASSGAVLLVEGTMQSIAAAQYAPVGVGVYGMAGCWSWRVGDTGTAIPDLEVFKGKTVYVVLDADAESNRNVYDAGMALRDALEVEQAEEVYFVRLPAGKKAGLDDVLGARSEDGRTSYLKALVDKAKRDGNVKPAARAPKAKKTDKPAAQLNPAKKPVDATDLDVADAYVEFKGDRVLFDRTTERWLTYHDGRWDAEGGATLARTLFRELIKRDIVAVKEDDDGELMEMRDWLFCAPRINHVLTHVSANPEVQVVAQQLDPDPWLWNAANCVIDLRNGQPQAHDPKLLMTQQSDVVYDPDAECPEFMRFLEFVLPDVELRGYVQRVLGMAMVGKPIEHIFPVFIGTGRNGKGTLIRLVSKVFGAYATGVKRDVLVETKFEGHQTKLATFFKKRLATTEEMAANSAWDVAVVKTLTGGDAITANYMRQDDFTFDASHTLLLATNHRPHVGEGEHAFWARYREIPFTQTITNPDSKVEDRMMAELSGILNWLLDGLFDYLEGGLRTPKVVEEATAGAKNESDPTFRFISENIARTGDLDDWLQGSEVTDRYKRWCEDQDDARPLAPRVFHKAFCTLLQLDHGSGDASKDAGRERVGGQSKTRVYRRVRWADGSDVEQTPTEGGFFDDAAANGGSAADGAAANSGRVANETPGQHSPAAAAADAAANNVGSPCRENEHQVETPVSQSADRRDFAAASAASAAPSTPSATFAQVSGTVLAAADWAGLLAADTTVLPQTTCTQCGAEEVADPELGVFRLCPECTSGTLRPSA